MKALVFNPKVEYKIRILSFNLWHGLNHGYPEIMPPAQFPLKSWLRQKAQFKALQDYLSKDRNALSLMLLQEGNPVEKKAKKISKELPVAGVAQLAVNTGIRIGQWSIPPLLQEGLISAWTHSLTNIKTETKFLSGTGFDYTPPVGPTLSAHLSERRGAIKVSGTYAGKSFCFVNLHMHSGRPHKKSSLRRAQEIDTLMSWLERDLETHDAIFIGGDFNCEHGEAELSTMVAKGFQECLPTDGTPLITWDPFSNPLCKQVSQYSPDPGHRVWDEQRHQLDHIYYWFKPTSWGMKAKSRPPWKIHINRLFDNDLYGAWLSDHFAVLMECEWGS